MSDSWSDSGRSLLDDWPEGEVNRIARAWQDNDGLWWTVVFDLTNLQGRIECVGVALQSSLLPDDADPEVAGFCPPPANAAGKDISLRPLSATTLRQLPFDAVLKLARRDRADFMRAVGALLQRSFPEKSRPRSTSPIRLSLDFGPAASEFEGQGRSKYDLAFLTRVAKVYQAAFEDRMDPPAKRVGEALGLTPDVARKLIHRCRDPRLRLLPPAESTRPRGWLAGERGEATRKDPPAD